VSAEDLLEKRLHVRPGFFIRGLVVANVRPAMITMAQSIGVDPGMVRTPVETCRNIRERAVQPRFRVRSGGVQGALRNLAPYPKNKRHMRNFPMTGFKKLLLAFTVLGASTAAFASDDNFASLTLGQTSDKIKKSHALNDNLDHPNADGVIGKDTTWGVRLGQQNTKGRYYATYDNVSGSHNGIKLRQENLLGSYDLFYPVGASTRLFGGATAGLTKMTQESPGFSRDSNIGYAIGGQAGVLQQVSQNTSVELGYRYLRSNASTEMNERGGSKQGSLDLTSSAQTYLSANYAF
jgi:opacity protein-like surface antigen